MTKRAPNGANKMPSQASQTMNVKEIDCTLGTLCSTVTWDEWKPEMWPDVFKMTHHLAQNFEILGHFRFNRSSQAFNSSAALLFLTSIHSPMLELFQCNAVGHSDGQTFYNWND